MSEERAGGDVDVVAPRQRLLPTGHGPPVAFGLYCAIAVYLMVPFGEIARPLFPRS